MTVVEERDTVGIFSKEAHVIRPFLLVDGGKIGCRTMPGVQKMTGKVLD